MEVIGHKAHGAVPEPGCVVIARVSFLFMFEGPMNVPLEINESYFGPDYLDRLLKSWLKWLQLTLCVLVRSLCEKSLLA